MLCVLHLKLIGKILAHHPQMSVGAKVGILTVGSAGNVLTYNIAKNIINNSYTNNPNVKTTISIGPANPSLLTTGNESISVDLLTSAPFSFKNYFYSSQDNLTGYFIWKKDNFNRLFQSPVIDRTHNFTGKI